MNFLSSSNSSVTRSRSSIILSTKVELFLIEKKKHGERNNGHNNKKCESGQNDFHGDLHSQRMVTITTGMPQSLLRG